MVDYTCQRLQEGVSRRPLVNSTVFLAPSTYPIISLRRELVALRRTEDKTATVQFCACAVQQRMPVVSVYASHTHREPLTASIQYEWAEMTDSERQLTDWPPTTAGRWPHPVHGRPVRRNVHFRLATSVITRTACSCFDRYYTAIETTATGWHMRCLYLCIVLTPNDAQYCKIR